MAPNTQTKSSTEIVRDIFGQERPDIPVVDRVTAKNEQAQSVDFACKDVKQPEDLGDRVVRFRASTDSIDRDGDVVRPEGISTDNYEKNPVSLFAHAQRGVPIGHSVRWSIEGKDFVVDIKFDEDDFADLIYQKVQNGSLNAVSIGFIPHEISEREELDENGNRRVGGFIFEEIELLEVSVVTVPANPDATVLQRAFNAIDDLSGLDTKALSEADRLEVEGIVAGKEARIGEIASLLEDDSMLTARREQKLADLLRRDIRASRSIAQVLGLVLDSEENSVGNFEGKDQTDRKDVAEFLDLPLASRNREWDSDAAVGRWRRFDGSEEEPSDTYWRNFLWWDGEEPSQFGSYKLPYGDIVDDTHLAVPRAIFAIAAVLEGAQGGVDIPDSDQTDIRAHVEQYYEKMRDEFDDENLVAPWNSEGDYSGDNIKTWVENQVKSLNYQNKYVAALDISQILRDFGFVELNSYRKAAEMAGISKRQLMLEARFYSGAIRDVESGEKLAALLELEILSFVEDSEKSRSDVLESVAAKCEDADVEKIEGVVSGDSSPSKSILKAFCKVLPVEFGDLEETAQRDGFDADEDDEDDEKEFPVELDFVE